MTDPVDTHVSGPAEDDWLTSVAAATPAAPDTVASGEGVAPRRTTLMRAGLLVVGAVAGALVVAAVNHGSGSSTPTANTGPAGVAGGLGGTQGGPQGAAPGGPGFGGGRTGEQHLAGTLTAIGASSITVRSTAGTATYTVTGSTEIVRDGAPASLSQLSVGDTVFAHVYPVSSSSRLVVERLFAGTSAGAGGAPSRNGGTTSGTTTTTST